MASEKPREVHKGNYSEKYESTQELDAYGVWVKSEPQVISDPIPDILDMLNFPNEPEALDEKGSASKTYPNFSLEPTEPKLSLGQQDGIPRESLEKAEETSINDRSILGDARFVDPLADNDELFDDLSEDMVIEDFLAASIPPVDLAGLSQEKSPALDIPDTPVKPPERPQAAHSAPPMQALDSEESLQLLRNILGELTLIRHEVSALKGLVIRGETAAALVEPQKAEGGGEEDEKVTITGDELSNIFHNATFITKALSPEYPALYAQEIDVTPAEEVLHTIPGNTKDGVGNEENPQVSPDEDEGSKDASHHGLVHTHLANPSGEVFLIDDLYIENGSMKDIPIALEPEDEAGINDAFAMIESIMGPKDQAETEDEPPDDTPSGSSPGYPKSEEAGQEPSTFSGEAQAHKPFDLKQELKNVLIFMDQLLESLPEDKIGEFAESAYFDTYQKLCNELGIA
ncbi:MAG: hypothetical protein LBD93_02905 [Treponema sp.]|jgi:hypothetical protein|nr:hypothetical protein [Treponema sp.]